MAQANGAHGSYIIAFSSISSDHQNLYHHPQTVVRPGPALHQAGNIALSNARQEQNFYPAGSYQTYHGSRGQQYQHVNSGYATTQRSAQASSIDQGNYIPSHQYSSGPRSVLEQGYSTQPYSGSVSPYNRQTYIQPGNIPASLIQPSSGANNPASLIQPSSSANNPASLIQPSSSGPYRSPTPIEKAPSEVTQEFMSPGSIIHATESKTSSGVTLFRSTIPIIATSEGTDLQDAKPSGAVDVTSTMEQASTMKVSEESRAVTGEDTVVLEEEVDYENIEVTRITTAEVHNTTETSQSVIDNKSEVSSLSLVPPEPEYAKTSTASGGDDKIASAVVVASSVSEENDIQETKVSVISDGSTGTVERPQLELPSVDNKKTDEEDEEVYSVVNKATRSSAVIVTKTAVDEDPYVAAPPIPKKTDEAYLTPEGDDEHSISSQGSALEEMRLRAQKRREELDYYSNVEVNPHAENKLVVKGNNFVVSNDDDDYATVEIPGDRALSSPREKETPEPDKSANHVPKPADAEKNKPVDFNLPKGYSFGGIYNVYLHQCNIINMRVDTIVNAANEKLRHKDGIAADIAKAAGKDFEKFCKKAIKKNGELAVSQVVMTAAGKLPSKRVIHAVGPQWDKYKDKKECVQMLEKTLNNIFKMCASERVPIVAIPPISSGLFHMPNGTMAECLHRALLNIPSSVASVGKNPPPAEIHVVDNNPEFLQALIEKLAGGNVTSEGQRFSVEELSPEFVAAAVTAAIMPVAPAVDPKKKKKLYKQTSLDKSKGIMSTFHGEPKPTHRNGVPENTKL